MVKNTASKQAKAKSKSKSKSNPNSKPKSKSKSKSVTVHKAKKSSITKGQRAASFTSSLFGPYNVQPATRKAQSKRDKLAHLRNNNHSHGNLHHLNQLNKKTNKKKKKKKTDCQTRKKQLPRTPAHVNVTNPLQLLPPLHSAAAVTPWHSNNNTNSNIHNNNSHDINNNIHNNSNSDNSRHYPVPPRSHRLLPLWYYRTPISILHQLDREMESFASYVSLRPDELRARQYIVSAISSLASSLYHPSSDDGDGNDVNIQVFGSFATLPVCTFCSDVDMAIWGVVPSDHPEDCYTNTRPHPHHHPRDSGNGHGQVPCRYVLDDSDTNDDDDDDNELDNRCHSNNCNDNHNHNYQNGGEGARITRSTLRRTMAALTTTSSSSSSSYHDSKRRKVAKWKDALSAIVSIVDDHDANGSNANANANNEECADSKTRHDANNLIVIEDEDEGGNVIVLSHDGDNDNNHNEEEEKEKGNDSQKDNETMTTIQQHANTNDFFVLDCVGDNVMDDNNGAIELSSSSSSKEEETEMITTTATTTTTKTILSSKITGKRSERGECDQMSFQAGTFVFDVECAKQLGHFDDDDDDDANDGDDVDGNARKVQRIVNESDASMLQQKIVASPSPPPLSSSTTSTNEDENENGLTVDKDNNCVDHDNADRDDNNNDDDDDDDDDDDSADKMAAFHKRTKDGRKKMNANGENKMIQDSFSIIPTASPSSSPSDDDDDDVVVLDDDDVDDDDNLFSSTDDDDNHKNETKVTKHKKNARNNQKTHRRTCLFFMTKEGCRNGFACPFPHTLEEEEKEEMLTTNNHHDGDSCIPEVSMITNTTTNSTNHNPSNSNTNIGPKGETRIQVIKALRSLSRKLWKMKAAHTVELRRHARVPIVCVSTRLGFDGDIAIAGHNGTDTSEYASRQVRRYASFASVVMVLKILLQQADLDKPFTGGLGSYKLYVLVAHHAAKHKSWGGRDTPSELLLSFLFRFGTGMVGPNDIENVPMEDEKWNCEAAKTHLERENMVLQSEDGGEADLRPVFKMGSCAALFGACFERLMVRLTEGGDDDDDGSSSSLPSCLGLMIDGARLKAERERCLQKARDLHLYKGSSGGGGGNISIARDDPGKVTAGGKRVGHVFSKGDWNVNGRNSSGKSKKNGRKEREKSAKYNHNREDVKFPLMRGERLDKSREKKLMERGRKHRKNKKKQNRDAALYEFAHSYST